MLEDFSPTRGIALLGMLVSALLLWGLFRQWERTRVFFSDRPMIGALIECCIIVLMAHALHGLLYLVSTLPRFLDWAQTARLASALTLHIGYALAVARLFEGLLSRRRHHIPDWRLTRLSRIGIYGIFMLFGVVSFLVSSGQTPTELFVLTGATAALLAFIMQQTLGDLFSGFSLTIERPFEIGNWIRLNDGTEGQVQDINWRATHLRKWDNTILVVPNSKLAQESFTNLQSGENAFAPWYTVKVSGDHSPNKVIALLEQAVAGCTIPLSFPAPVVRLMDGAQTPYTYTVWVHFANYSTMFAGRGELYRAIDEILRSNGIEVAADIQEIRYRRIGVTQTNANTAKDETR